jgi:arylsulfatase A
VPFIARAPWLGPGDRVSSDLVDFTDMLPTFAEMAGAPLPEGVELDGHSFTGSLKGEGNARSWVYSQRGENRTVRDRRFKVNSDGSFFDMANDPLEKNDLRASSEPEIAAARKRLSDVLASMPADAAAPFEGFRPRLRR